MSTDEAGVGLGEPSEPHAPTIAATATQVIRRAVRLENSGVGERVTADGVAESSKLHHQAAPARAFADAPG
jgi:hypothetical protein